MNIRIPQSWLKTLLETNATPVAIAEKLSLSGSSVEKIERLGDDTLFDIEITTNRPDAFSVLGVAREAYTTLKYAGSKVLLKKPEGIDVWPKMETAELSLKVKIEKPQLCPRFTAVILDNVKIQPSPNWMQKHLESVGNRPINNVVDISNYLMFELGQPMHTFDYEKILQSNMTLRESRQDEQITTLDGAKRTLPTGTIVIEDKGRLIDLCGIMGGANSQISEKTKRVLLFVQTYDPARIRMASQALGLRTEASSRFEKGPDTEGVIPALNRAVFLLKAFADAKVASKVIDIYPAPYKSKKVTLEAVKLNQYLGISIPLTKAASILEYLGFETSLSGKTLTAVVPSYRAADIELDVDLIEEIARITGYNKIPNLLPIGEIRPQTSSIFYWEDHVRDYLKYQGFYEVYTNSMISRKDLDAVGIETRNALKIKNPLNQDLEYMRPTLLPSLLKVVAANQNRGEGLRFFELAARYEPRNKNELPAEILSLAGVVQGNNFYQLKGILEGLFDDLGIEAIFTQTEIPNLGKGQTAKITANGAELGRIGKVDPKVLKAFNVEDNVFVFGLLFETLANLAKTTKKYTPIPKYPEIVEDISMVVDTKTEVGKILEVIKTSGGELLKKTEVFDIFSDSKLGKDKKSVAVHLIYRSQTHNLTTKEVEDVRKKIISALESEVDAKVRLKEA